MIFTGCWSVIGGREEKRKKGRVTGYISGTNKTIIRRKWRNVRLKEGKKK